MNMVGLCTAVMKAAGISIDDKTKHELEVIIPQIPAKAQETIIVIGNAITLFDTRLMANENLCKALQEQLNAMRERDERIEEKLDRLLATKTKVK